EGAPRPYSRAPPPCRTTVASLRSYVSPSHAALTCTGFGGRSLPIAPTRPILAAREPSRSVSQPSFPDREAVVDLGPCVIEGSVPTGSPAGPPACPAAH